MFFFWKGEMPRSLHQQMHTSWFYYIGQSLELNICIFIMTLFIQHILNSDLSGEDSKFGLLSILEMSSNVELTICVISEVWIGLRPVIPTPSFLFRKILQITRKRPPTTHNFSSLLLQWANAPSTPRKIALCCRPATIVSPNLLEVPNHHSCQSLSLLPSLLSLSLSLSLSP
jgi:hypothetical protein